MKTITAAVKDYISWSEKCNKEKAITEDMYSALVCSATAIKDYGLWSEKCNKEIESSYPKVFVDYRDCFKVRHIMPEIKKVIFNDPATIVFWSNGEKTVVKCQEEDIFDPEKGLAMAITKMALGNRGNYFNEIKKWLPKQDEEECKPIMPQEIFEMIREKCSSLDCLGFGFDNHDKEEEK